MKFIKITINGMEIFINVKEIKNIRIDDDIYWFETFSGDSYRQEANFPEDMRDDFRVFLNSKKENVFQVQY